MNLVKKEVILAEIRRAIQAEVSRSNVGVNVPYLLGR